MPDTRTSATCDELQMPSLPAGMTMPPDADGRFDQPCPGDTECGITGTARPPIVIESPLGSPDR
jgi:hypothetical protein